MRLHTCEEEWKQGKVWKSSQIDEKKQEEAKYERTMNTSALFWNFKLETCKKWRKMQMNEKQYYITLKFWSGEYPFKSRKKWQKAITKDEFENFELSKANSKLSLLVQNH